MNLLFVTGGFPYGMGETFIESEIDVISKRFDEVFIIALTNSIETRRELNYSNVQVLNFYPRYSIWGVLRALGSLFFWREILTNKMSIHRLKTALVFHSFSYQICEFISDEIIIKNALVNDETIGYSYWLNEGAGAMGLLKLRNMIRMAISRVHRWDLYFEIHKEEYLPFRRWLGASLDMIFPISQDGKSYLSQRMSETEKISVARLGTKAGDWISIIRDDNVLRVVSCSYVIKVKRVHLIYEALSKIKDVRIEWVHFGGGPLFEELCKLINSSAQDNLKVTLKGHVSNQVFLQELKFGNFDLFINASESEGIPVSIMEAMSRGLVCLGTDVGGVSEIIENEVNGWLLNPENAVTEIDEGIRKYINLSPSIREKMAVNARTTWMEKYDADKNYNQFFDTIYSTL